VIGWLASPDANREGAALMITAAVLPIPLLLPRAGLLWSLPALAPLLGAAGIAPLYVALAALAPSPWRRAGAAAAGLWWIVLAEALTGNELLFGAPSGVEPHGAWQSSLSAAATDGLLPTIASSALLPAAPWALFAFALPVFVRGRALVLDILGAGVWAAGLIAAHSGLARLMEGDVPLNDARGAVAGALLAVVAAVVAAGAGLVSPPADEETSLSG
jgi:hypothetical protein